MTDPGRHQRRVWYNARPHDRQSVADEAGRREKASGQGRGHEHGRVMRSSGRPTQENAPRIATKGSDVLLQPFQRRNLVEDAVIARGMVRILRREGRMREESEGTEAVVQGHHDGWGKARPGPPVDVAR